MKIRFTLCCGLAAGLLSLSSCSLLSSLFQVEPPVKKSPAAGPAAPADPSPPAGPQPVPELRRYTETPTAKWTDDIPNAVWSPYLEGRKVAVDGIAPGTLVADPNCAEPMKALFYVPEVP